MKRLLSFAAMAALLSATGCTQHEIFTGEGNEAGEPAILGISTGVLTAETKSVVGGDMITYAKAEYTSDALGLGVVVLNADGNGAYSGGDISADHIWFMGDEKGENWKSVSARGDNFAAATAAPYTLNDATGMVYAYYPKAATVSGSSSSNLTIPAPLKASGTITVSDDVANADLRFEATSKTWIQNSSPNRKKIICASDETDFLFANNVTRTVSNGRVAGSPGRSIDLTMAHALSMVSFRLYNDGTLPGNGALTKIVIQNATNKTLIKTTASATMNLATGVIGGLSDQTSDKLERTVNGYTIPKEIKSGDGDQTATTYIVGGIVTGPKVARKISILTYPIANIPEGDIEVVFTIDGTDYTVALPVTEVYTWLAGSNYVYTVCASQRKLEVTSVSVAEWNEETGGNIDL